MRWPPSFDILVNNAGITRDATLRKMDKAGWDAVLRTNLDSMFNVTKPFIDPMVERGWGRIINISSINGSKGQFGQTNYSAAKAGVHGFTKALAQEVARKGVTVNTVSPGYLATEMVMAVREDVRQKIIDAIPVGRLGQPDEIAALVAFIASDAAAFMTGSNVAMNGGQHMYERPWSPQPLAGGFPRGSQQDQSTSDGVPCIPDFWCRWTAVPHRFLALDHARRTLARI
jgi:acetoacetyl-CoA reductase